MIAAAGESAKSAPTFASNRATEQEVVVDSDTDILPSVSSEAKSAEKPPSFKAAAANDSAPLLKRSGIFVTRSLIDLHGRSYSVPQLNSIKVDAVPHPHMPWLVLAFLACGGLGLILLLLAFAVNEGGGGFFIFSLLFLGAGIYAMVAAKRLPQWALLRFEMSSGKVKALNSEKNEVEEVADAIRTAMAAR